MIITTGDDGFTRIEVAGLEIIVPTNTEDMGDDRAEIRCGGSRVFVESHDDGPLVSAIERWDRRVRGL